MKHLVSLAALCLLLLTACNKTDTTNSSSGEVTLQNQPSTCDFGITQFNLTKRAPLNEESSLRNPHNSSGGGSTPPPTNPGIIMLDFDGHMVSGTNWNGGATINCAPANLSSEAMSRIITRVGNDYIPFNITITTDEAIYNAAPANRRMRVILTETWEWFGQAGGVAYRGSFTWGNNTPCFVFTSLLNYNEKHIGEAASHEAGHTFGLRHQATYSGSVLTSAYNYGTGTGEIAWAPIMGCGYYRNLSTWHNGPTEVSSTSSQDETAMISGLVGYRTDDFTNTSTGARALTSLWTGIINNSTDIDFFSVDITTPKNLSVKPVNIGPGNEAGNLDLVLNIYNTSGQLISTINDPLTLNAVTTLNPGQYYVSVTTVANAYAARYGMIGRYTIMLN
jgi:Metallo-peptidase family M12B Reprolysin-like